MRRGEGGSPTSTVAVQRLGPMLGQLPASITGEIEDALRLHLKL